MGHSSRREAFERLTEIALGTMFPVPLKYGNNKDKMTSLIIVGPYEVEDWFLKALQTSPLGGVLSPLTTPKPADVAKVLRGCRLYIVDRSAAELQVQRRFPNGESPKVVVEGSLSGEWKDGKKSFALYVARVALGDVTTTTVKESQCRRIGRITVTVHLWGSDGEDTAQAVYHFSSGRPFITYDASGATQAM